MKKLLVLFLFLLLGLANGTQAQENFSPIELDESDIEANLSPVLLRNSNTEEIFDLRVEKISPISGNSIKIQQSQDFYSAKQKSFVRQKTIDDFTLGVKTDTTILPDSYKGVNTFFTTYSRDDFSFNTSYSNDSTASFQKRTKGTLSFSPQYRVNKFLTLKTAHSSDFMNRAQKNEVILNIKPMKEDRLNLNFGLGQTLFQSERRARPQMNFSTDFRF